MIQIASQRLFRAHVRDGADHRLGRRRQLGAWCRRLVYSIWAHLLCLIGLCALTYIRGRAANKVWLLVFPFLATAFDLLPLLTWIPLVPTVMHLLAIILGVVEKQVAAAPAALAGR